MIAKLEDKKLTIGFLHWIGAIVVATIGTTCVVVVFAYANFQTDEEADEDKATITQRLDRIENKLDRVVENTRK